MSLRVGLIDAILELNPRFANKAVKTAREYRWLLREYADAARAAARSPANRG